MADLLRDIGLAYADMLPVAIGGCAVAIVLVVWAAAKAVEMTSEHRAFIIAMAAVLIGVAAQLPAAVASARDYCSSLAPDFRS